MTCRKRSFPTKAEAIQARRMCEAAAERGLEHRRESRIYRCPSCRAYHLTSTPHRQFEEATS